MIYTGDILRYLREDGFPFESGLETFSLPLSGLVCSS